MTGMPSGSSAARSLTVLALGGSLAAAVFAPGCSASSSDACDHLLRALEDSARCGGYTKPLGDADRARWRTYCESVLALPDQGLTASLLDACAGAQESASCEATHVDACNLGQTGAVAVGGRCAQSSQCTSGRCEVTSGACGTCGATGAAGDPCTIGTACAPGTACDPASMTCVTKVYLAAGQACDGYGRRCDDGLFCDGASKACKPRGGAGAACTGNLACKSGFVCAQSVCTALPDAGQPCLNGGCAAHLACDTAGDCNPPHFAEPGQPCDATTPCRVGSCPPGTSTACPTIVADGQPCNAGDFTLTCDTFASCVSGVCTLAVSSCR